jgi:hypothetical protein
VCAGCRVHLTALYSILSRERVLYVLLKLYYLPTLWECDGSIVAGKQGKDVRLDL